MHTLLCSTGALITSKNGRNYNLLSNIAPHIPCDGFEFMMYRSWYDIWEQLAEDLSKMKVPFPTFHVDKSIGELISRNGEGDSVQARKWFEINCKIARTIGAKKLVLHLWGGLPSDKNIEYNIAQYEILQEIADRFELLLTVENVVCNQEDPLRHFWQLKEKYPTIAFTFDVRFARFHGQLDTVFGDGYDWLWSAVRHIHISDYAGGYMDWTKLQSLHPLEGNVDFPKVFQNLKQQTSIETVTIESTSVLPDGEIDFEKINRSLAYLRRLME